MVLTVMDEAGQTKAHQVLEGLEDRDSTNIWDGLHAGLEVSLVSSFLPQF